MGQLVAEGVDAKRRFCLSCASATCDSACPLTETAVLALAEQLGILTCTGLALLYSMEMEVSFDLCMCVTDHLIRTPWHVVKLHPVQISTPSKNSD
jgi:hypothetical protein